MTNPDPAAGGPARRCRAWWCRADAAADSVLCEAHHADLTPELRAQLASAVQGAVAFIAAARMQALFSTLPEETRADLRERARRA